MKADNERQQERDFMVRFQIAARGIRDKRVLDAMRRVPRHLFVPSSYRVEAYEDYPLPIGSGQTISQPFIVAFMAEALLLKGDERILEIGTGSGYQTAILSLLAKEVYSIERIDALLDRARTILESLEITNVELRLADGFYGWEEKAPFDAIILSAAPFDIPSLLLQQLADGGRLVGPVGPLGAQTLVRVTKHGQHFETETLLDVAFVPMRSGLSKV
ncbi:MAG TPA: protein-L-isoaspartate(D-aspartate) O-methyltransferase [Rectinema sp.]|jgi:protein-L-isoaspartate(D-aspartate) O-methyltransferase|nr:protein-L-isoaspartate(D-aspartate) O-methyltransferase [Spirochaetia bacterium]OQC72223.1 MAG: Protein-L-isoaspartate O-methyltransferase [Spirochaetes bacterium ADurb.Bin001]HNP93637.1 protein-L-isoaspartate(D-aspartate) O-methyltransferase [Rectinema sp.]HNT59641.1 protein-L-isoaspartate(D-aspartate) O-methyltransferase [Rectinema sp.]HNV36261.1 protein-L-isoaspartate(D-aspartate) O-methyltransferase [Rectinema sp.]